MLYTKPIDQISWEDIDAFCQQQISENNSLDYKQDFPNNLEKTIAAMANTTGGIIIVGVKETHENKPDLPISGIPFQRGLSERVTNVILSNITPPVFPEIWPCRNPAGDLAVVLIRIPQSHQTPHAIASSSEVYLRYGNRNRPEKLATISEIEWLQNGRKKSFELKQQILSRAHERFVNLYCERMLRIIDERKQERRESPFVDVSEGMLYKLTEDPYLKGDFTVSLCPLFPRDAYCSPPEMNQIYRDIKVNEYFGVDVAFPLPNMGGGRMVQDGILLNWVSEEDEAYHTELNCFGLYYYKQLLMRERELADGTKVKLMWASEIFCRLDEFLDSSLLFFNKLGYAGLLEFRMRLEGLADCPLCPYSPGMLRGNFLSTPDRCIEFSHILLSSALQGQKMDIILGASQKIGWAFDWNVTRELLESYFEDKKPKYRTTGHI